MAGKEQEMVWERPLARPHGAPIALARPADGTLPPWRKSYASIWTPRWRSSHRRKSGAQTLFPRLNYSLERGDPEFPTQELAILDSRFRENDEGILAGFSRSFQKAPIAQRR